MDNGAGDHGTGEVVGSELSGETMGIVRGVGGGGVFVNSKTGAYGKSIECKTVNAKYVK